MNHEITGRKEITENVVQALLVAAATGLVNGLLSLGLKAVEAKLEKRKKNNNAA